MAHLEVTAVAAQEEVITGGTVVARALAASGVKYMFGVIGIPVTAVATEAQKAGIRFISFRNEQAAGYAASAVGYLTGTPAALLTVSGPGMIHGLAGCGNALANCWPLILISGSVESDDVGKGGFQEVNQPGVAAPLVKSAARPSRPEDIGRTVAAAVRTACQGIPGATYVDLPADMLFSNFPPSILDTLPKTAVDPLSIPFAPKLDSVKMAAELLLGAKRPLLVVGRGAAYCRAEQGIRDFVDTTGIPFLPTPMGKGVVPDSHSLNASAARSMAIGQADVALVVGTRLNWQLHFGETPRWKKDCKFIMVNIDEEEMGKRNLAVALCGDAKSVVPSLHQCLKGQQLAMDPQWPKTLTAKASGNTEKLLKRLSVTVPAGKQLDFHGTYGIIKACLESVQPEPVIVSEGANTMDIGRSVLTHQDARKKMDAGAWGTMGVGLGYSIASAVTDPSKWTVAIEGDSAFGFSGMECEVMCRYKLPIMVIVFNNSGVYGGDRRPGGRSVQGNFQSDPAPTDFVTEAQYHQLMSAFGGRGLLIRTQDELRKAMEDTFKGPKTPVLLNVIIDPQAGVESGNMQSHNNARPQDATSSKL